MRGIYSLYYAKQAICQIQIRRDNRDVGCKSPSKNTGRFYLGCSGMINKKIIRSSNRWTAGVTVDEGKHGRGA